MKIKNICTVKMLQAVASAKLFVYTFLKQGFVCFYLPKNILNIKFQCEDENVRLRLLGLLVFWPS